MSSTALNPAAFLKSLVGKQVVIRSKWGPLYSGTLISCDSYMNLQLQDCVEHVGEETTPMSEVLFRCNNVLYIRQVDEKHPAPAA